MNTKVAEIAGEVGMTPSGWNGGIFNMIRSLSETVIVPIAGIILTFIMCYELIQLIVEKNNLHDFDTWLFWKWIFKTLPVGIKIGDNSWVKDTGWYEMDVAVGFGENAKNMDLALEFLEYISRE